MPTSISYSRRGSASKVAQCYKDGGASSASTYLIPFPQPIPITLYRKNRKLPPGAGFYKSSNSTSTLRAHFTREGGEHYKYYREICEKNNVPAVAKSPDAKEGDNCSVQSDISSFVVLNSPVPPWHREGLLSHLCEWIVLDNQVRISLYIISYILISNFQSFSVVEKESFKALLNYQRPSMTPRDLPSRTTVTDEIYSKSIRIKGLLAEKFKLLDSRVSFTFDAGTSRAFDPYLTVTSHWIDANWNLHEQVLAFREIVGDHSGENTGALLINILREYGLVDPDKLGWGTADGSTVCDKAIRVLAKSVDPTSKRWVAKERRARCMEHAIHCASRAFVTKVGPTPMASIKSALSSRLAADATDEDDDIFGAIEELAAAVDTTDDLIDTEEFDPADLLGKILAFINQVRSSPQARAFFHKLCKDESLQPLQLLKWIRTRWASLYDLIARLLDVRPACNKFTLLADDDNRVPDLKTPKTYAMFKLTEGEWRLLELIRDGLREPALSCQSFSHATRPTVYRAFPVIESMQQKWERMAKNSKYAQIVPALEAGLANLRKWYRTLDDSSIYFICLILDPRVKMAYFQTHWEEEYLEAGTQSLKKTVSHHFRHMLIYALTFFLVCSILQCQWVCFDLPRNSNHFAACRRTLRHALWCCLDAVCRCKPHC